MKGKESNIKSTFINVTGLPNTDIKWVTGINKTTNMSAIIIEKGIPFIGKTERIGGNNKPKYPFKEMEIGDSFLYSKEITERKARSAWSLCSNKKKALGAQFKWAETEYGIRIWRTK